MKNIIIRADDLGYSKGVNYGTYESVKNGLINNVGEIGRASCRERV